jgi:hypothetical protein
MNHNAEPADAELSMTRQKITEHNYAAHFTDEARSWAVSFNARTSKTERPHAAATAHNAGTSSRLQSFP